MEEVSFSFLGDVTGYEAGVSWLVLDCGGPKLKIAAASPKVIRATLAPHGVFNEESYAVVRRGKRGSKWRTAGMLSRCGRAS